MEYDDKKLMEQEYQTFLTIIRNAINIVRKYIDKFSSNPEYNEVVNDLRHGLEVLEGGYKRIEREGIDGLSQDLKKYPKGKRPGLSLSRGFGEFLYAINEDWIDEIMDAVHAIEDYYANM